MASEQPNNKATSPPLSQASESEQASNFEQQEGMDSPLSTPGSSRPPSPMLRAMDQRRNSEASKNIGDGSVASTPGSTRPPSPLLKSFASMALTTSKKPARSNPIAQQSTNADGKVQHYAEPESLGDRLNDIKDDERLPPAAESTPPTPDSGVSTPPGGISRKSSTKRPHLSAMRRPSSNTLAPFMSQFEPMTPGKEPEKIAVVGSGSWATALARIAAASALEKEGFDEEVRFWVREREEGKGKLTDLINTEHEHVRYLPGIELPENLRATPDVRETVKDATAIVFCVPHQFLPDVLQLLKEPGVIKPGARAISAIKGVEVTSTAKGTDIKPYPYVIERELAIPCSALGGANIALEVAKEQFCEATIGTPSTNDAQLWHAVFDSQMFRVHPNDDVPGVSLSGALKNIVALAAGFVDGLGLGGNTKAAILRIGLVEMAQFSQEFFPSSSPHTFSHHSAGVADLITTSFGGRNHKCAKAFVETGKSFEQLEEELLKGQKLQGTLTSKEVHEFLVARERTDGYPLFEKVYQICFEGATADSMFAEL